MLSCKQHESFIPRDDRLSLEAEAAPQIGRVRSRQFFGDLRRTFMAMTDSVRRLMPKVDSRAAPDGRLTRGGAVRASDGDSRDQRRPASSGAVVRVGDTTVRCWQRGRRGDRVPLTERGGWLLISSGAADATRNNKRFVSRVDGAAAGGWAFRC